MKERDTQRSKLYKAERAALIALQKPVPTVKDVERFLLQHSKRTRLRSRYGVAVDVKDWPLQVADGRGTRNALAYDSYKVSIPTWARLDWVVLHEWAHIIHSRISKVWFGPMGRRRPTPEGSRVDELKGGAAHGWQYAAIYLDLVKFCMGAEAEKALKAAFKKHRVRFRPKAKRQLSPEHRAKLIAAAERARAARLP